MSSIRHRRSHVDSLIAPSKRVRPAWPVFLGETHALYLVLTRPLACAFAYVPFKITIPKFRFLMIYIKSKTYTRICTLACAFVCTCVCVHVRSCLHAHTYSNMMNDATLCACTLGNEVISVCIHIHHFLKQTISKQIALMLRLRPISYITSSRVGLSI